jgi:hypothetical protein
MFQYNSKKYGMGRTISKPIHNLRVFDRYYFLHLLALDPFGSYTAEMNKEPTIYSNGYKIIKKKNLGGKKLG